VRGRAPLWSEGGAGRRAGDEGFQRRDASGPVHADLPSMREEHALGTTSMLCRQDRKRLAVWAAAECGQGHGLAAKQGYPCGPCASASAAHTRHEAGPGRRWPGPHVLATDAQREPAGARVGERHLEALVELRARKARLKVVQRPQRARLAGRPARLSARQCAGRCAVCPPSGWPLLADFYSWCCFGMVKEKIRQAASHVTPTCRREAPARAWSSEVQGGRGGARRPWEGAPARAAPPGSRGCPW